MLVEGSVTDEERVSVAMSGPRVAATRGSALVSSALSTDQRDGSAARERSETRRLSGHPGVFGRRLGWNSTPDSTYDSPSGLGQCQQSPRSAEKSSALAEEEEEEEEEDEADERVVTSMDLLGSVKARAGPADTNHGNPTMESEDDVDDGDDEADQETEEAEVGGSSDSGLEAETDSTASLNASGPTPSPILSPQPTFVSGTHGTFGTHTRQQDPPHFSPSSPTPATDHGWNATRSALDAGGFRLTTSQHVHAGDEAGETCTGLGAFASDR